MVLSAQTGTSSPYSMYGVGDLNPIGIGRSRALGGAGIALPTESSLNNINPASYSTIDSLSFLTDIGLDLRTSTFVRGSDKQSAKSAGLGFLAVGFRNTSWWKNSLGLVPFSSVGNNITIKNKVIEGSSDALNINIQGTGGLSQFYWGNAFKILPNLSIGANVSFIFGNLKQTQDMTSTAYSGNLLIEDNIYLHKLYLNYGAQYSFKLSKNIKGMVGLIYGGPCKLNMFHNTATIDNSGVVLKDPTTSETSFTLPAYYGAGLTLRLNDKLLVTSDYKMYNWANTQPFQSKIRFVNSDNYMVGAEYTPSNSFRDAAWKRFNYRVGGYVNNTYLMLSGQQIQDKGLTFGLGLPLAQKKLYFNFTYQVGQKGASSNQNIITEYYQNFSINITLFDFWFIKPKFD